MEQVLLASELDYYNGMLVDIYYPPNYKFESKLPVIILSHGLIELTEYDKDMNSHMDWAKLIAANGMVAVSAQVGEDPVPNAMRVFDFLGANANMLGLDMTRIGFWACSGQGGPVYLALEDPDFHYRSGLKAGLFTYLDLGRAEPNLWPKDFALFVVKANQDVVFEQFQLDAMDDFIVRARASKLAVEYIQLPNSPHGFDLYQDNQQSKDIVARGIAFLKSKLLP